MHLCSPGIPPTYGYSGCFSLLSAEIVCGSISSFTGFLNWENYHILESKCSSKDTAWLRTNAGWSAHCHSPSQSLLGLVPAVAMLVCTWWLSYPALLLSPMVSYHGMPLSLNSVYWAKALFCSVSLKVDRSHIVCFCFWVCWFFFFF